MTKLRIVSLNLSGYSSLIKIIDYLDYITSIIIQL